MKRKKSTTPHAWKTVLIGLSAASLVVSAQDRDLKPEKDYGNLDVGGAIRANYVNGDYAEDGTDAPQRGDNGGNFELDTFRVNADYDRGPFVAKAEYRWYNGYNMLHTGWVGWNFDDGSQLQAGLNRVPFGPGAYGASNNWFFDQHYYIGLSDDMDYGVKYSRSYGNWEVDLAYYLQAEHHFTGDSKDSARYSYDIVESDAPYGAYTEEHQVNLRMIYKMDGETLPTDVGVSLQWGQLDAENATADDSEAWAASLHTKTKLNNWTLVLQLSEYSYDADYADGAVDANGVPLSDDLITMGAYDFAWPVAAEGTVPSVALSYTIVPENIGWIDSLTFYNDYSVILKDGEDANGGFNDSAHNVTGVAIASGGWYVYVDYAYSNGNYFVGDEGDVYGATYAESSVGDFGANRNDDWNGRFNINFGYYF